MSDTTRGLSSTSRAWVEVDIDALEANCRALCAHLSPYRALMAVVKADAYGHGILPVARAVIQSGARWLGVATVSEGADLRLAGISVPIALLCNTAPGEAVSVVEHGITPMVGDQESVAALTSVVPRSGFEVHLDIDTGIGRSGVQPQAAVALWRECRRAGLRVTGVCTHFADADGVTPDLSTRQSRRFTEARGLLAAAGARFDWVHATNSASTLRAASNDCNLVRPGLLLYGLLPTLPTWNGASNGDPTIPEPWATGQEDSLARLVRPIATVKARVGAVRELPSGHTISYGATVTLRRPSRVATILIGYGDGYPRRLSNRGEVILRGKRAPILGRVCMDQTVVDVTDIPEVAPGDVAVCIGSDGRETIAAETLARCIGATEHEITTCLNCRLPRVYRNCADAQSNSRLSEP